METSYISCAQEKVFWEMKELTDCGKNVGNNCSKQLIVVYPE